MVFFSFLTKLHVSKPFLWIFFQLSIEKAQAIAEQVDLKAKVVQSEVKTITLRHKKALEERECELLWKVNERTNIN